MANNTKDTVTAHVVDFSNVKDGGNFNKKRVPAGDYLATVTKVQDAPAKGDGVHQYLFTIKLKAHASQGFPYYCKLQENQLWKLRNLLIAAGMNVPKNRVKLDPSKIVNKVIGVTMEDDEYEGKEQSEISAIFPASELDDTNLPASNDDDDDAGDDAGDDDDQWNTGPSGNFDTSDDDEADGDDDEEEATDGDEFDGMDRAALKAHLKAADPSFQAKKSQTDDDLRELARAADDTDDEDEEDEPEPEPAPKPRKAAAKKKAATKTEEDELEELDIDDL